MRTKQCLEDISDIQNIKIKIKHALFAERIPFVDLNEFFLMFNVISNTSDRSIHFNASARSLLTETIPNAFRKLYNKYNVYQQILDMFEQMISISFYCNYTIKFTADRMTGVV